MFRNILLAFDGTPTSLHALKRALELTKLTGATLTALSVAEKLPLYAASVGEVEETRREMDAHIARIQEQAVQQASASGIGIKTVVRSGAAAQVITQFASQGDFDLIIIGADGQDGLGSTADKVVDLARCSVLIARLPVLAMQVKDIMTTNVTTVSPDTPLGAVAEMLIGRGLKALPVMSDDHIVGIITGGDLLRRAGMRLRVTLQRNLPGDVLAEQWKQLDAEGKTAADVMSKPVITVGEHTAALDAARLMVNKHVKRVPVVNAQGRLVGIVSRFDILTTVAATEPADEGLPKVTGALKQTAGDIMFRQVPTVSPETPLNDVLNKLVATPLRRVIVVDEGLRVVGIIIDTDLLNRIISNAPGNVVSALIGRLSHRPAGALTLEGTAADVMVGNVFSVREDTPLIDVIQQMLEKRVKRLVVLDDDGRLLGMVDRQSILQSIASQG